jgi:hypothetical protein
MFHITEQQALSVRNRIIEFGLRYFREKSNWHIQPGAERVYAYRLPTIGDFFEDGGNYKLFSDISEAAFIWVLKQMKKVGSVQTSAPADAPEGFMVWVFIAEHFLLGRVIPGVRMYLEDNRYPRYEFYGNIHKSADFNKVAAVSGGAL